MPLIIHGLDTVFLGFFSLTYLLRVSNSVDETQESLKAKMYVIILYNKWPIKLT